MNRKISKATEFKISCWSGDTLGIEPGKKFVQEIINTETDEIVFKGNITTKFIEEIQNNHLTKDGVLKWFSLVLYKDKDIILSSGHYGTEMCLIDVPEDEILEIKNFAERFDVVKRVDIWQ